MGHAEAIDYRNYQYKPPEAEHKYYLSQWATLYFERNRYSIERDQINALYFLNSDVQQAVIQQEQQNKTITNFSRTAHFRTSISISRMSFWTTFGSRLIRRELSLKRCTPTPAIIRN